MPHCLRTRTVQMHSPGGTDVQHHTSFALSNSLGVYRWTEMFRHVLGHPYFNHQHCPFTWGSGPTSNTWFLGPTQVNTLNCITIGSAIFAGLTVATH